MAAPFPSVGAVAGEVGRRLIEAAKEAGLSAVRAAPGVAATAAASVAGAVPLILTPTNTQSETHPITEDLRVRTAPGQRSATVERRVDHGLLGTGIGEKWDRLPVKAEWASRPDGRRFIAIDPEGLRRALDPDAVDAALRTAGIAMAKPPSDDQQRGVGDNSRHFNEELKQMAKSPNRHSIRHFSGHLLFKRRQPNRSTRGSSLPGAS
jgi:hypothetical protein